MGVPFKFHDQTKGVVMRYGYGCFTYMVLTFSLTATCLAQDVANSADAEATHEALRALRDDMVRAMNEKDTEALLARLHENIVFTAQDGDQLKSIRGRDGIRDYLDRLLTGSNAGVKEFKTSPTVDELTILYNDDTGVAFGSSLDNYVLADGTTFDLPTRWSATVVKNGEDWQVANLHVLTNLFKNPVLDSAKRTMLYVGLGGAAIGLALGFFVGRRGRRSTR